MRRWRRSVARGIFTWLASCSALQVPEKALAAPRIYAEYPIAGVTVGWDARVAGPIQRVITMGVVAEDNEELLLKDTQNYLDHAVRDVAQFIRMEVNSAGDTSIWRAPTTILTDLAAREQRYGRKITHKSFLDARAARGIKLHKALLLAAAKLRDSFAAGGLSGLASTAQPVLILRECPANTPVCSQFAKDDAVATAALLPSEAIVDVVGMLLAASGKPELNEPLNFGSFAQGEQLRLELANRLPADAKLLDLPKFVPIKDAVSLVQWPNAPTAEATIRRFEDYVERLRTAPKQAHAKMATIVPLMLGFAKTQLLQVQDVASEAIVIVDLLPDKASFTFKHISDELGRTRIIECARLRGASTAEQVADCAGYDLSDDQLFKCMAGAACRPVIRAKAVATILDIDRRLSLELLRADPRKQVEELLDQADLPRLMIPQAAQKMRESAKKCADEGNTTNAQIARCMSLAGMSDEDRKVVECLSDPSRLGQDAKLMADCLGSTLSADLRSHMTCVSQPGLTPLQLAKCAGVPEQSLAIVEAAVCASTADGRAAAAQCYAAIASEVLGADAGRYAACINDTRPMEECIASVVLSNVGLGPEAARMAQCVQGHSPENTAATIACVAAGASPNSDLGRVAATIGECLAVEGGNDPQRAAALCAARSLVGEFGGRTAQQVAACAANGVTPGAAQCVSSALAADIKDPLTRCVVQGGASVLAMQTCALANELKGKGVADRLMMCALSNGGTSAPAAACALGIDPNKREIAAALQCAAYSPDANSFAICATGQIVMMTVTDCLHSKFGKDTCFGPNNELQRALRTVGIDLSSNTLPGKYIDATMEVYRQQIYLGTKAVEEVGRFANDVGDALKDLGEGLSDVAKDVGRKVENLAKKAEKTLRKIFGW